MDISQIELGENYARTCLQGSDTLVISFEPGGWVVELPDKNQHAWAQNLVAQAGWDGLFILPKVMNWYQSPELWDFFKSMKKTGFLGGYRRIVMYGNSMGGFAALLFARLAGAHRVVALHPRSTLNNKVLPWPSEFSKQLSYNKTGPRADALHGLMPGIEVMIFVDPFHRRDKRHADRIAALHRDTELIRVPFAVHLVPQLLKNMGILSDVAQKAIGGRLDPKLFYKSIRARKEDEKYVEALNLALLRRRAKRKTQLLPNVGDIGARPRGKNRRNLV